MSNNKHDFPEPANAPGCFCAASTAAQFFCRFGHIGACHYPLECAEALCEITDDEDVLVSTPDEKAAE